MTEYSRDNTIDRCKAIVNRFLDQVSEKDQVSCVEAAIALEIKRNLESINIVKLGDANSGLLPTPKAFEKMVGLLKEKRRNPWDHIFLVWDDLLKVEVVSTDRAIAGQDVVPQDVKP